MIDDRDLDGIEDKFDSTFNTPEELLEKKGIKRIVTIGADEEMLKKLANTDIPFFAQKTLMVAKFYAMKEMKNKSGML